ncbi:hypothetical protein C8R46DRAFT_1039542 [Mycena filopes]|nr:hypothetical protein C8R46DRAFT_1039542 [Mycena filopes]
MTFSTKPSHTMSLSQHQSMSHPNAHAGRDFEAPPTPHGNQSGAQPHRGHPPRPAGEGGNVRASQRAYSPGQSASSGPNPHAPRPPSAPAGSWDEDSQYFPPSRDRGSASNPYHPYNSPAHHPDATAYKFPTSPMQYHNPAVNTGGPSRPKRRNPRQPSGTNKRGQKPEPIPQGGGGGSSAPVPPNSSDPEPENGEGNGYNSDWEHELQAGAFHHQVDGALTSGTYTSLAHGRYGSPPTLEGSNQSTSSHGSNSRTNNFPSTRIATYDDNGQIVESSEVFGDSFVDGVKYEKSRDTFEHQPDGYQYNREEP